MNKQPFYHAGHLRGDSKTIIKMVKTIKTVLKSSVEYVNDELLFTATSDVGAETLEALKKIPGTVIESEFYVEPGDPADLM